MDTVERGGLWLCVGGSTSLHLLVQKRYRHSGGKIGAAALLRWLILVDCGLGRAAESASCGSVRVFEASTVLHVQCRDQRYLQ